ncbi:MAG: GNAT family N-acetyltransferase [Clostridia bacterium]|nr:GNAT family N-acetyltransferase [Clostridia bacterium]
MIFNEKTITLKNGTIAVLKSPSIGDGEKMLNYIKTACGETDFLLRYPEEWEGFSIENEEKWIKNIRNSNNNLAITCYIDGEVAGNGEISFRMGKKAGHRASLAIAILKKYWGLGIGSAIFEELLAAADARERIEIVELEFIEGNDRAQALYEKFGFSIVCERPNALKLKDGRTVKEIFMQKIL